jgi:hypothetical protein
MSQHVKVYGSDGTSEVALKVDASGNLTMAASAVTYTNRSSTITLGGTAQTFAAANTSRRGYRVQNLSATNLYINDKGATAVTTQTGASFTLVPGAMYESNPNGVSTSAISIIGATTSQAFEGAEW